MAMTQNVRVTNATLEDLKMIRDDFFSKDVDSPEYRDYMTLCDIIDLAVGEYIQQHDPEFLREKQRLLEKDYVTRKQFEDMYEENRVDYEQDKKTMNFLQDELQRSYSLEEHLNLQLKKQTEINTDQQKTISDRDIEIAGLKNDMSVLVKQKEQLNQSLIESQKKYNDAKEEVDRTCNHYHSYYTDTRNFKTLFIICRFLFRYKKRWFTIAQLDEIFWNLPIDEIKSALELYRYSIFPIITSQDGNMFKYDTHCLHRKIF